MVATHGWVKETSLSAVDFARSMVGIGVRRFIYTDIDRDGTLTEPNFGSIRDIVSAIDLPVVAAGGVCSVEHLKKLKAIGVEGAIIGKALYTGDINLKKAISDLEKV